MGTRLGGNSVKHLGDECLIADSQIIQVGSLKHFNVDLIAAAIAYAALTGGTLQGGNGWGQINFSRVFRLAVRHLLLGQLDLFAQL